jgi:hypothetical protein
MQVPRRHAEWFAQMMYEHLDWVRHQRWDYRRWIAWANIHGFLKIIGEPDQDPIVGLIWRPIPNWIWQAWEDGQLNGVDYWRYFYEFDRSGDNCWVDFLWAPGHYREFIAFMKSLPYKKAGWQHRNTSRVHVVDLKKLPVQSVGYHRKDKSAV